jgi:predicted transcriptional regulator of viral defense system
MNTTRHKLESGLFSIADSQQGYFTAKQAIAAGYVDAIHPYHVKSGSWIRIQRGIYRLAKYPHTPDSSYVIWSLWSRNRNGVPQGVYSHETSLSMFDLSDANPSKLHLTVPPGFRRHSKVPAVLVLHKGNLSSNDIQQREGYSVTRPARTLHDLLTEGITSDDIIRDALREALSRGLLLRKECEILIKNFPEKKNVFQDLYKGMKGAWR